MNGLTRDYCERRASEEVRAAKAARCSEAANSHSQLAEEHRAKARDLRSETPRQGEAPHFFGTQKTHPQ